MVVAKEMTKQGLDQKEVEVIALSVEHGFTNGSINSLEWELETYYGEHPLSIAASIREGITEGRFNSWILTHKRYSSI